MVWGSVILREGLTVRNNFDSITWVRRNMLEGAVEMVASGMIKDPEI